MCNLDSDTHFPLVFSDAYTLPAHQTPQTQGSHLAVCCFLTPPGNSWPQELLMQLHAGGRNTGRAWSSNVLLNTRRTDIRFCMTSLCCCAQCGLVIAVPQSQLDLMRLNVSVIVSSFFFQVQSYSWIFFFILITRINNFRQSTYSCFSNLLHAWINLCFACRMPHGLWASRPLCYTKKNKSTQFKMSVKYQFTGKMWVVLSKQV